MRLDAIKLDSFRCFEELTVTFDQKLTVLVALNGSGKTTILDAIRIALWPYVNSFDLANSAFNDSANTITIDDVTIAVINEHAETARLLPAQIQAFGELVGITEWERFRTRASPRSQTLEDSNTKQVRYRAREIQEKANQPDSSRLDLPVVGYYGTGRLWSQKKLTSGKKTKTETVNKLIRTYGYRDCLDPASSYKAFEDWYTKACISNYAELLKIGQREKKVALFDRTIFSDRIEVVQNAINTVLSETEWRNIAYDANIEELVLTSQTTDVSLKVRQLSDGVRNMIGLVADIAYRCCQLNAHLGADAAKQSKGIILIDEVDMHLHPQWQQLVLKQLQEAFPNLQFIVTTHSAQVLSTVSAKHIRIIRDVTPKDYSGKKFIIEKPAEQTRGIKSSDILAEIMATNPIPNVSEANDLSRYKGLIQQGLHTSDEGLMLRKELNLHFGENHSEIKECERLIRLVAFKHSLPKRGGGDA